MAGADVADGDKADLKSAMARFGAVAVKERIRDPANYEQKLAAALQDGPSAQHRASKGRW